MNLQIKQSQEVCLVEHEKRQWNWHEDEIPTIYIILLFTTWIILWARQC